MTLCGSLNERRGGKGFLSTHKKIRDGNINISDVHQAKEIQNILAHPFVMKTNFVVLYGWTR